MSPESLFQFWAELLWPRFERIFSGILLAILQRSQSHLGHPPRFLEPFGVPKIHRAPVALRLSRRESLHVRGFIYALADAVDPAKTQRLVERFGIGNAGAARPLVVEPEPQFLDFVVVPRQPGAERRSSLEYLRFHAVFLFLLSGRRKQSIQAQVLCGRTVVVRPVIRQREDRQRPRTAASAVKFNLVSKFRVIQLSNGRVAKVERSPECSRQFLLAVALVRLRYFGCRDVADLGA